MKSKATEKFKTSLAIVVGATAINVAAQFVPQDRQKITNIVYMGDLDEGQKAEVRLLMEQRGNVCEVVKYYDKGEVKDALHCTHTQE